MYTGRVVVLERENGDRYRIAAIGSAGSRMALLVKNWQNKRYADGGIPQMVHSVAAAMGGLDAALREKQKKGYRLISDTEITSAYQFADMPWVCGIQNNTVTNLSDDAALRWFESVEALDVTWDGMNTERSFMAELLKAQREGRPANPVSPVPVAANIVMPANWGAWA